jgi:hypothetical protein
MVSNSQGGRPRQAAGTSQMGEAETNGNQAVFFLPAMGFAGPLRVRALVCVR